MSNETSQTGRNGITGKSRNVSEGPLSQFIRDKIPNEQCESIGKAFAAAIMQRNRAHAHTFFEYLSASMPRETTASVVAIIYSVLQHLDFMVWL